MKQIKCIAIGLAIIFSLCGCYDALDITVEDPERQVEYYGSDYQAYYESVNTGVENQYGHKGRYNLNIIYSGDEYNNLQ